MFSSLATSETLLDGSPLQSFHRRKNKKKTEKKALLHNCQTWLRVCHKLPFPDNNYWLISHISGERGFQVRKLRKYICYFLLHPVTSPSCALRQKNNKISEKYGCHDTSVVAEVPSYCLLFMKSQEPCGGEFCLMEFQMN